ncbi:sister-chromatid cohesion protein 3 [Tanacetum coccineum]
MSAPYESIPSQASIMSVADQEPHALPQTIPSTGIIIKYDDSYRDYTNGRYGHVRPDFESERKFKLGLAERVALKDTKGMMDHATRGEQKQKVGSLLKRKSSFVCTEHNGGVGVRKASILALQDVYDVDGNVPSLRLFTERFYKRMLDLADDNDISFAALVFDHVISQKFNSSQSRSSVSLIRAGDEGDQSQIHLLRMLQILREFSTNEVLSLYIIDDIWEFMDAMKVSSISRTCLITLPVPEIKQVAGNFNYN